MVQDTRAYYTFYGIYTDDWDFNWGSYDSHQYMLVKNYISEDASTTTSSTWDSEGRTFLYPHYIKKKYYLEGVVEGQITFTNDPISTSGTLTNYKVDVIKESDTQTTTVLATTGIITVTDTIGDADTKEYAVYPFWIDVLTSGKQIGENERLGIVIDWNVNIASSTSAYLSHENWQDGEDVKITLPLLL
jgi:hypothetical protein